MGDYMYCRMSDFRNKQVVCVKNGCVFGFVSDIEVDTNEGKLKAIVIQGRLRFLGVLGREDDIVIPWEEISVVGKETVLVNTDPEIYINVFKNNHYK